MPGNYPFYHSLVDKLAAKVINRIAADGVSMEDAILEAINYAELTKQQVIHLCATLADYGMVYNGEPKDFFYTPADMGKDFPSIENGYVVYANKKDDDYEPLFEAVHQFKKAGFTNEQILDVNPNLDAIIAMVDEYQKKYFDVLNAHEQPLQMAASVISSREVTAQAVDVEKPTPENIDKALGGEPAAQAPAPAEEMVEETPEAMPTGDETVFEDETGVGEAAPGGASVTITPSPSELKEKVSKAPKWTVENILSIDKAKNYYDNLRKELEEVVFNDKISMGEDVMKQYDEARASIDEQVNKIDEAQKATKKVEEKKDDIEQEFQEPAPEGNEKPTEGLLAENEGLEPAPPAPAAPAPAPK